ncbi:hypothetical protein [Brevundimonas sp. DC300-4]|uniref:hypothetical protein n=1 Tax=Brevundimonas sp. DC300-4 TaxID=2804594 RepID=UPI003CE9A294
MNDQILPIANEAPLRLRLERQLGYKMAKHINRWKWSKASPTSPAARAATENTAAIGGTPGSEASP